MRGQHAEFVFAYSQRVKKPVYEWIETMNNTAWQSARKKAGLSLEAKKSKSPHANKKRLGIFLPNRLMFWRARQDLNPRPPGS